MLTIQLPLEKVDRLVKLHSCSCSEEYEVEVLAQFRTTNPTAELSLDAPPSEFSFRAARAIYSSGFPVSAAEVG